VPITENGRWLTAKGMRLIQGQYRCGAKAANDLDAFITRRPISCLPIMLDRYPCFGRRPPLETEYPKVLTWKEASSMASTWTEYLRLSKAGENTAVLEVCMYEGLGELVRNDDEELILPEQIDGKKVLGVEDGIIFGGELMCWGDEKTFSFAQTTLKDAVAWLRAQHWNITAELVHELTKAVGG
jgi:hypothetical protein